MTAGDGDALVALCHFRFSELTADRCDRRSYNQRLPGRVRYEIQRCVQWAHDPSSNAERRHEGNKVYIEFPSGIVQAEMPPLFVVGPAGGSELVNYRVNRNYCIVNRLFAAAELSLGDKDSERRVRIVRTDGRPRSW
nr:TrbG/VirB9 family P-type conjugative transfer protein [Bradyrhizobium glycinis]